MEDKLLVANKICDIMLENSLDLVVESGLGTPLSIVRDRLEKTPAITHIGCFHPVYSIGMAAGASIGGMLPVVSIDEAGMVESIAAIHEAVRTRKAAMLILATIPYTSNTSQAMESVLRSFDLDWFHANDAVDYLTYFRDGVRLLKEEGHTRIIFINE